MIVVADAGPLRYLVLIDTGTVLTTCASKGREGTNYHEDKQRTADNDSGDIRKTIPVVPPLRDSSDVERVDPRHCHLDWYRR